MSNAAPRCHCGLSRIARPGRPGVLACVHGHGLPPPAAPSHPVEMRATFQPYRCRWCGEGFPTRLGSQRHLRSCAAVIFAEDITGIDLTEGRP
jgi:hypothetical protein